VVRWGTIFPMDKPQPEIVVEPARSDDRDSILAVLRTTNMHNVPSPEMPELDLECFFVVRIYGRIVGCAGYRLFGTGEGKTTLMAVDPAWRGHGIGLALQTRRMEVLAGLGVRRLVTNADIPETIAWYERHFDYRRIGTLPKLHEFGRPDIDRWTTLETDPVAWLKARC